MSITTHDLVGRDRPARTSGHRAAPHPRGSGRDQVQRPAPANHPVASTAPTATVFAPTSTCRTCGCELVLETTQARGELPREVWSDGMSRLPLVCFAAVSLQHSPSEVPAPSAAVP